MELHQGDLISIDREDNLYRHLHYTHMDKFGNVTRRAFMLSGEPEQNISVYLARLTTRENVAKSKGTAGYGTGVLKAEVPFNLDFEVVHDPVEGNRAHCELRGSNTLTKCDQLAQATSVVIAPSNPSG